MAKVKMNAVVEKMSGAIGDLVFRSSGDNVVVSRKPEHKPREKSPAQLDHTERFRLATSYAKAALGDSVLGPVYASAAKEKHIQPYPLAVGDFLNAPTVDAINLDGFHGKAGDAIVIRASDDIAVVRVTVTLRNEKGTTEMGEAVFTQGSWRYVTRADLDLSSGLAAIDVTALDHPGNKTTQTAVKQP
ncbi:MAG: hypothetical protein QM715_20205 [Nibricoccus sp.]